MASQSLPPNDFARALTELTEKYGLPSELLLRAVEEALASAYRREVEQRYPVAVHIDQASGQQHLFAVKHVVTRVRDEAREIGLAKARQEYPEAVEGDDVEIAMPLPENWGRIAAQAFKQIVQHKIRDAEQSHTFERYADQEGELVSGLVTRLDGDTVYVGLGDTEAVLPPAEQVPTEQYKQGQRVRAFLMDVHRTPRGTQLVLSRSHRGLLRRLLELEVPEVHSGAIELKAIAREPGSRSKVAVAARQEGLDPVGACVGVRSVRIQNVVAELNGEKVDIIVWHQEPGAYVANALSPATVVSTEVLDAEKKVVAAVPANQLSLAIGKEGQNARLAARLTGWRIDIHAADTAPALGDSSPGLAVAGPAPSTMRKE